MVQISLLRFKNIFPGSGMDLRHQVIAVLFLKCTRKWVNRSSLKGLKMSWLIFFFLLSFPFIVNTDRPCFQAKNSCLLSHIILCHKCTQFKATLPQATLPSTLRKNRYKSSLHLFASNVTEIRTAHIQSISQRHLFSLSFYHLGKK